MKNSYKAYAAATQTVAKTKQIVLLYDAAIRYAQQAEDAIANQNIEARYNALEKACAIVFGLQGSLDFEQGGEIARTLYDFYSSIDARLISVHRSNDAAVCKQVIKELKMMREAWAEIDSQDELNSAPPAAQAAPTTAATTTEAPLSPLPDASGGIAISA
jgi:flagellar protein FliS